MPTKEELIRLQNIYRTDKKIGEALGGIPEYLVAYWRRKKGISKPSFAKYSEAQIRELWERYGDDFHCGRELGISKAAFYSWRRKYNIKEKPQALKLEQLELRFGWETKLGSNGVYVEYYQTAYQKILSRASGEQTMQAGDIIRAVPDIMILPAQYASAALDPRIEAKCWWVRPHGFDRAEIPAVRAGHLLNSCFDVLWRGLIRPNQLIATTCPELHALGAFSTVVVYLDEKLAPAALEGQVEIAIPPVVKVSLSGRIPKGLSVIDLLGFFFSKLPQDSFQGKVIEFSGAGVEKLSGEEKMALCYHAKLAGAEGTFCLFDESSRRTLAQRTKVQDKILFSDRKAHYESEFLLNSVGLVNYIFPEGSLCVPAEAKGAGPLKPNTIFIGGPCGGSAVMLKSIAEQARGKKLNKNISCFISPLTQDDLSEGIRKKSIATLVEFGCELLPSGTSLADFMRMSKLGGTIMSVPDRCDDPGGDCRVIFASGETAIEAGASGKGQ